MLLKFSLVQCYIVALSRELLTPDKDCNSSPLGSGDKGRGSTVLGLVNPTDTYITIFEKSRRTYLPNNRA